MDFKEKEISDKKSMHGKSQSFEETYLQYVKQVYYMAYSILRNKEDAEDITNDVFEAFFELDGSEHVKDTKNYLLTIAKNKSINYLKKKEKEYLTDDINIFDKVVSEYEADDDANLKKLWNEIYALPSEERQILILHVKASMKFGEIAKAMGLSLPATYRRYKKAICILQEKMKGVV